MSTLQGWVFAWPQTVQTCAYCYNLYEFICASVLLCVDDAIALESPTTAGSYNLFTFSSIQIPEPCWKDLMKTLHSVLNASMSVTLYTVFNCGSL